MSAIRFPAALLLGLACAAAGPAGAVPVSLVELTGLTGGTIQGTAVFKADLSTIGIGSILSISISDDSSGLGGATGQFSGFDLDAIKLSNTDCATAACAQGAAALAVFDFGSGTFFTPGTQRPTADPKLFGTGSGGATVDNAVATLGLFDGESTTAIPGADGYISLGDDGVLSFNLTSGVSTLGLFLYIGEVGNNGEVAASNIEVRQTTVPEPGSIALLAAALCGLATIRRTRRE